MPSWSDLKRFCERDGWELYKQTDHYYYQKLMPDGTLKRTNHPWLQATTNDENLTVMSS